MINKRLNLADWKFGRPLVISPGRPGIFALPFVAIALALPGVAMGYDITEAITASDGIAYPAGSPTPADPIVQIATFAPTPDAPVLFSISATAALPMAYNIEALVGHSQTLSDIAVPAMVEISTNTGNVSGTSSGSLVFLGAAASYPDQISNGALRIIGGPALYNVSGEDPLFEAVGGDISWTHTGTIRVVGVGDYVSSGPLHSETGWVDSGSLNPGGFLTAQLSGIVAASYGDQDPHHTNTWPGGSVSVTSSGVIQMENNAGILSTAGISASAIMGPGEEFATLVIPPPTVSVTLDGGRIENSADRAFGILAVASGAQFLSGANGEGDTAFGGNVSVQLRNQASITQGGGDAIGILAVSEVYTVDDAPKHSTVQSGTVSVLIEEGSSVSTGTTGSVFSIGVLAISAGSDVLLSPFTSQQTNGHGVGNAGTVDIVNSGSVSTRGVLSAGLAALSIGGAGIVTTNSGTDPTSYLGNSGTSTSGVGNAVNLINHGEVTTLGANAYGMVALSSGGGGLVNNEVALVSVSGTATAGLIVGNNTSETSGSASNGGAITVANSGTIVTGDGTGAGVASMGIVAQSIGGAGGNAGGSGAALFVGDKGGMGGSGGTVGVTLDAGGQLTTKDENSIGVLAQSIGGGGGNGANSAGLFVAVGGAGGKGGNGGAIAVGVDGAVTTLEDHSSAIIAQSVGGGGGHGGTAVAFGVGGAFGLGGHGGEGGSGGTVTGNVGEGTITTLGNNSTAMHLQSIGGGGGTGGAAISRSANLNTGEGYSIDVNVAVGGSGGDGGNGGAISGTNQGLITTGVAFSSSNGAPNMDGADSIGIMAQSIGGGGGHGGLASAKSAALSSGASAGEAVSGGPLAEPDNPAEDDSTLSITIGANVADAGAGGSGGDGGAIDLANSGTIVTWGDGSYSMLAQSIGGGGGNGGDSTSASTIAARSGKGFSATIGLGGAGGDGGSGGEVTMVNSGGSATIETHGQYATGMIAQSIGGGGGTATMGNSGTTNLRNPVTGTSAADVFAVDFDLGGKGGAGGDAGYTEISNGGSISTAGSGAMGILAQAIGGGGGNASGGVTDGAGVKVAIDLSIGRSGGDGGSASGTNSYGYSVMVTNTGTILTTGGDATGIMAQSIGGGGGNGGSSDANAGLGKVTSITSVMFSGTSYESSITVGASVGGSGGDGGRGGSVYVNQNGTLSTEGFQSYGILAQSISGGGGKGGTGTALANPALFDVYDKTIQFGAFVAVGGQGGDGFDGGSARVDVNDGTSTSGYGAHAVVAQYIGGGGGIGADGSADITSSLGLGAVVNNSGGTMGDGGTVTVNQLANISTAGAGASGIVAQSIAGGGGLASTGQDRHLLSISPSFGILPLHLDATLGVNLQGNDTANGGTVNVSGTFSSITTEGDFSTGIVAQSIGAGGGKASTIMGTDSHAYADFSGSIMRNVSGTMVASAQGINLGAVAGQGAGGTVNVSVLDLITTGVSGSTGFASYGVLAQSIGGGGGLVTVDTAAANGTIRIGSSGTAAGIGGDGGDVTLTSLSSVVTAGDAAHAVVVQSVGGGGGVAAVGSSRTFSGTAPADAAVDMHLGSRDAYGQGGTITGSLGDAIITTGDGAFGVVAQSIGGGGGIGTAQQPGDIQLGMTGATQEASLYNGGSVTLTTLASTSSIETHGEGSHGLVAQSIGGGGGIANPSSLGGLVTTPAALNTGAALGYGGDVSLEIGGSIQTSGGGANGLVAQVISGGGGLSGSFAGSTGGALSSGIVGSGTAGSLEIRQGAASSISAGGQDATAIFAQNQSAGELGRGSVGIDLYGTVTGGSGTNAYGIWVDGGTAGNQITVEQTGQLSALSKNAINYTGDQYVNVDNLGIVKGAITLTGTGGAAGTFNNRSSGAYYAEGDVRGIVNNEGVFIVGIDDTEAATVTLHDFYGTSLPGSESIVFDALSTSQYDRIEFAGTGLGSFGGEVAVNFSASYQVEVGDLFTLIGPGLFLGNEYAFEDFQITYQGQTVFSGDGLSMQIDGVEFSFLATETTDPGTNSFALLVTAVPEPSTILLAAAGAALLCLRRRPANNRPRRKH